MANIQWYPGHMTKARRMMADALKKVDAVIELRDARIPVSSRNPDLSDLLADKPRVLILNKADLADRAVTRRWQEALEGQGIRAIPFSANRKGANGPVLAAMQEATRELRERWKARGVNKTLRLMVVGIPNCGKSTFINRLAGEARTRTADRPGVTRGAQWVRLSGELELMDTPGMLWPKFEDPRVARHLAFVGTINDEIMSRDELAEGLIEELMGLVPDAVRERFRITGQAEEPGDWLEMACKGRGWLMKGGVPDTERAARLILDEFRGGKLGSVSLEAPGDEWDVG